MTDEYIYHTDAGHGWLEVPRSTIASIGMKPEDFSGYSYCDAASLYLEEDGDMTRFLKAFANVYGRDPVIREIHARWGDSVIRTYSRNASPRPKHARVGNENPQFARRRRKTTPPNPPKNALHLG